MSDKKDSPITGFKGFDKDLKCREMQFEIGKTHKHVGPVKTCHSGFHFCEHPLDVFGYYPPGTSRFAQVRGEGEISKEGSDMKIACSELHIEAEVDFSTLIKAAVKFVFDRAKWTKKNTASGESEAADYSRPRGAASATGYRGAASATGNSGAASATGKNGIASSLGIKGRAKGAVGVWLVLCEWKRDENDNLFRADTKAVQVDGKKIKADTFYSLSKGKFVEA